MPRILFISTVYPTPWQPYQGPANRSTVESLRLLGAEVEVVAPVPWHKRRNPSTEPLPPARYPTYWYPPLLGRRIYHQTMWWSIKNELKALAESFRPEAVLAFWADPDGTVAVRLGHTLGIPSGVIAAGTDVMILPSHPPRQRIIARTLRQADHVFAVGSEIARRAVSMGAAPERVSNFIAGVDLSRFQPGNQSEAREHRGLPPKGRLLLWVGNMVPVKAADRVLQAAARLAETDPDLRVAMVGSGPLEGELRNLAASLPTLSGRVHFPGPANHDELPWWYRAADLLVLPSLSEGVPNVILEAMATGLPFVASKVGSIADLLPFGPSRSIPPAEMGNLSEVIRQVLNDPIPRPLTPIRHDRLDGARHLLTHLRMQQP